ncbi:hypothetical protein U0070_012196, partial [Myodes glareolus]
NPTQQGQGSKISQKASPGRVQDLLKGFLAALVNLGDRMFIMIKGIEEVLLQHFIQMKQDIADAINKPFPFFEAFQDHYFITEEMYKANSLDACQDVVPVPRVMLNVLTSLEQTFHPPLLLIVQPKRIPQPGGNFQKLQKWQVVTADEGKKRSVQTLLLPNHPHQAICPLHQESVNPEQRHSKSLRFWMSIPQIKSKGGIWSTPKRKCQKKSPTEGVASLGQGVQKKLKVVDQRTQRKNDSTRNLKMYVLEARESWAQLCKGGDRNPIKCKVIAGMSKDDTLDFLSPTLAVTCSSGKCIQNKAGDWLTPKEFLMEGKMSKSKDWKRVVQCKQKTLRFLE